MLNQEEKQYFRKIEEQRGKLGQQRIDYDKAKLRQEDLFHRIQQQLNKDKNQEVIMHQNSLKQNISRQVYEEAEKQEQVKEENALKEDLQCSGINDYHILNTCEFKYCQNLSRELKIQTIGLRKELRQAIEKRQILKKIVSRKINDSQSPLIDLSESQNKKSKNQFSLKALPTGIDINTSSIKKVQEYFSSLYYSQTNTQQTAIFQANFESIIFKTEKQGCLKITKDTKITPLLCYLGLKNYLEKNKFLQAAQFLKEIIKTRPQLVGQFFSQDIIDLVFDKSIENQSNQVLQSLINICIHEGIDISSLKLERFRIPIEYFLSQLSSDTFDPYYAKIFLKYYVYYHKCRAIRQKQRNQQDDDPILKFNSVFNINDLINISQLFRFLCKFQDGMITTQTNTNFQIHYQQANEDVLLDLVDFWTKYGIQLRYQGQNCNILHQNDIVEFLINRCRAGSCHQSENFIVIHQILKRYSSVDNSTFANTLTTRLRQQIESQNILFPFKKQTIRNFYNTILTKKAEINQKGAQFWAFTLRQLELDAQMYDLATNWDKVTGSNNKDLPLYYLADMIFSLPLEQGEHYYKAIQQLVDDMQLTQISKQNNPLILLLKTKAYFKDGNNNFAIKNFLDEMKKFNSQFGNQSEDQLVKLSNVYNSLVKNPKTGNLLSKDQFKSNYGKMLEQVYGNSAIIPFTEEVKTILQERNYVELKYLFEYLKVNHQASLLQQKLLDIRHKGKRVKTINQDKRDEEVAVKEKIDSMAKKSKELQKKLSSISLRKLSQIKKYYAGDQFINSIKNYVAQYPKNETDTITNMLSEYTQFVKSKKYLRNHINQIQEQKKKSQHPLGLENYQQFTSLKKHLQLNSRSIQKKRIYDDENDDFQSLFSPASTADQLNQSFQSILKKYDISQKNPDHLPIFTALAMFHGQIKQQTGSVNIWSKNMIQYSKWLKLKQNLKIIQQFIQETKGNISDVVDGQFKGYIWKFLLEKSHFKNQSPSTDRRNQNQHNGTQKSYQTGKSKKNSMLNIEFHDNSIDYNTIKKYLINIAVSPNVIESNQVNNTSHQIKKLLDILDPLINEKNPSIKKSKKLDNLISLISKLRYNKLSIANAVERDIEQFKLLHDSQKLAKIRYIKAQAQQILGEISYSSGILTDLNQIKQEYDSLLNQLKNQQGQNQEKEGNDGKLSDKNIVALMLLQSKRTKARIQQMERKLLTLKRLNLKYKNPKVVQGKKLAERVQDFGMNSIQLFKDTVRLRYLQDFKQHQYMINLPSITVKQVQYAKQEMREILHYELQFFFHKKRKNVSSKAQQLYFEMKKYNEQNRERKEEKKRLNQQRWRKEELKKRMKIIQIDGGVKQAAKASQQNMELNKSEDDEQEIKSQKDDGTVDQDQQIKQAEEETIKKNQRVEEKNFYQGINPEIFQYKSSKSALLQHPKSSLDTKIRLENQLQTKNRRGEQNSKLVSIQIPNPKKTHPFNQFHRSERNRIIPSYYVGSYNYPQQKRDNRSLNYFYDAEQRYLSQVNIEQLNKANDPKYDRFDPYQMKQAHFNKTLGDLKPLLVKQIGSRQHTVRQQIQKAFGKIKQSEDAANYNSSKRFTNSLSTTTPQDIDINDDKIVLKNPSLTLDKITIFLEDQVHSDLLKKLKLYQDELGDVNCIQFAQTLSNQTINVQVDMLEQLFVELHYKKQLLNMIENYYQKEIDQRMKEDITIQNYLNSLEVEKLESNKKNYQFIDHLYDQFAQIEMNNDNIQQERKDDSRSKQYSIVNDQKKEKAELMKKMFGINQEYYPANYALDLVSFGLQNDIPAAVRLGEAALIEIPNASLPQQMRIRIRQYLEFKQENYNQYMQATGPLAIQSIYKNQEKKKIRNMSKKDQDIHFLKRGSYWEAYFKNLNAFDSWKIPSRHRDQYSKYKGLERVIPKQCLDNLNEMKKRVYYI